MKKRIVSLILCLTAVFGAAGALGGCTPRENTLIICNWNDYLDESYVKNEFPKFYKERTGRRVKVKYTYFDTNEDMLFNVQNGADYDVVCPSDYMNERMQKLGLLEKLDKNIVYDDLTAEELYEPAMLEIVGAIDGWLDYALPYIWGTLGILYRGSKVADGAITDETAFRSWESMFTANYSGGGKKIYMKKSERDAFAVANIYNNTAQLSGLTFGFSDYTANPAYMTRLREIMSEESAIDSSMDTLAAQRDLVFKYEVDGGKADFVKDNNNDAYYGLFWSCDAGYAMAENQNLYYEVPVEGSNVWMDAFVVLKNAKNMDAAQHFMRFLLEEETAMKNAEAVGSSTPLKKTAADLSASLEAQYEAELAGEVGDDERFFTNSDRPEAFYRMYMSMMFPDADLLSRCAMMRDFSQAGSDKLRTEFTRRATT